MPRGGGAMSLTSLRSRALAWAGSAAPVVSPPPWRSPWRPPSLADMPDSPRNVAEAEVLEARRPAAPASTLALAAGTLAALTLCPEVDLRGAHDDVADVLRGAAFAAGSGHAGDVCRAALRALRELDVVPLASALAEVANGAATCARLVDRVYLGAVLAAVEEACGVEPPDAPPVALELPS